MTSPGTAAPDAGGIARVLPPSGCPSGNGQLTSSTSFSAPYENLIAMSREMFG